MHYRAVAFSKDGLSATIVPKDNKAFFAIGQRVRFSPTDIAKLNALYNCDPNLYRGLHTRSPASESEKGVASEYLFTNTATKEDSSSTTSEKESFSKPETEIDTTASKHGDKLFSKLVAENNMSAPKPGKNVMIGGLLSEPGTDQGASSSEAEDLL
jgi:hypothetical protein